MHNIEVLYYAFIEYFRYTGRMEPMEVMINY